MQSSLTPFRVAVIGGGPAGLMAAQTLAQGGAQVDVYDAMPSVGRKFLLAGRGGMNITHAEPYADFVTRYGKGAAPLRPMLDVFGPQDVRDWVHGLGVDTFVGTSGRVFPTDMKAAPLLRAWLHRLRESGVRFHMRHRWLGWRDDALVLDTPDGELLVRADAVVLALGGGSWARLGSDGAWVPLLAARGVGVAPLAPANCGFDVDWSEHFSSRHAGEPLTTVAIVSTGADGREFRKQGQFVVTQGGVEGSLIYALSAALRDQITANGYTTIYLDLLPDLSSQRVADEVARPRGARSMASHLQSRLGIKGVKAGLLRECLGKQQYADEDQLAQAIKRLPVRLLWPRPIDEAISSAGGVRWDALEGTMLKSAPGVFVAGEMVDWEAPTGGYLLTACLAGGQAAGRDVLAWLKRG
ncbi:TIGR03862 family flavoprotein [Duganella sp. BJB488]|uniref:TIGR03862 family flavoprotein n=1 Tax=unclassified Duganella TaxID=2636909 RepID=UPI000E353FDA|nr:MULTISPECIES: TIGR03862 family flavoprotein [unclassified Duganella]RFP21952.1 TIGR03862 family flavoprotein [Duganella sp. BJB489]RFP23745.1 TIGR03862 family flavoprotein [Duganella sp. BJB488]RFP38912.1 TIGR03862 family flavoprotein [Duganella sp. BJB480]